MILNVSYGLGVIMCPMYSSGGGVDSGGGGRREGVNGNSVLSAPFFCEPKTTLKNKIC